MAAAAAWKMRFQSGIRFAILKGDDQMGAYSLLSGGGGASISTTEESALETCATDPRASVFS
jgi:hypothetical protein